MSKCMLLGVNIDHIATLRQQRLGMDPDPVHYAHLALLHGADSIVCHLREDRRHIQEADVQRLMSSVPYLNLELSFSAKTLLLIDQFQPHRITFVPENRDELTTESGIHLSKHVDLIQDVLSRYASDRDISFFIDPDLDVIELAIRLGIPVIELNTAAYARAMAGEGNIEKSLQHLLDAADMACRAGIRVVAGHGLDRHNISQIVSLYPMIDECNIGFSLVTDALEVGWPLSIERMACLLKDFYREKSA